VKDEVFAQQESDADEINFPNWIAVSSSSWAIFLIVSARATRAAVQFIAPSAINAIALLFLFIDSEQVIGTLIRLQALFGT
jgi:hypothetical protein